MSRPKTTGTSPMLGVILPVKVKARLESDAVAEGRSASNYARWIIESFFRAQDAQAAGGSSE